MAERLSRWARIRLLRVGLEQHTQADIAELCGVSRQAVSNWLTKETYHPNDENAGVLLKLAWRIDKKLVKNVLRDDVKRHISELKKAGIAF